MESFCKNEKCHLHHIGLAGDGTGHIYVPDKKNKIYGEMKMVTRNLKTIVKPLYKQHVFLCGTCANVVDMIQGE